MGDLSKENGMRPPCGDNHGEPSHPRQPGAATPGGPSPVALVAGNSEDWWRPYFGLTPHVPEGRETWWALVPNRYRTESLGKMAPVHRVDPD